MRVGFIGWRGMVGSVLRARMTAEGDWTGLQPVFFSTSNAGGAPPDVAVDAPPLADAFDVAALAALPVLVSCQGSGWTKRMVGPLRDAGWDGIFIDASSAMRMADSAVIVLDPLNRHVIEDALHAGTRDFIGGNCTVSLMLMAVGGLFQKGWVEWATSMTYQAASGAGARQMRELVAQMRDLGDTAAPMLDDPATPALDLERAVTGRMRHAAHPTGQLSHPLAGSLLPWIDTDVGGGQSREEWKGMAETNKILGLDPAVPVDGLCVRTGALRCHANALTVGLTADVPLDEIEAVIAETTPWTHLVPNTPDATLARLTPAAVTGSLAVPVGRVRKLATSRRHLGVFTVGDQLLWGAAEPLRRMLRIVRER
jgi:aspartate-semialdehyde dehydrogenase